MLQVYKLPNFFRKINILQIFQVYQLLNFSRKDIFSNKLPKIFRKKKSPNISGF